MAQTFNVGVGGVWKPSTPYVGVGGVWKPVQNAYVGVGGVWKQFYNAFSASVAPSSANWGFNGTDWEYSLGLVATPTGGTAPYTYLWSCADPNVAFFPATNNNIIPFSSTGDAAVIICTVTDNLGAVAVGSASLS